MVYNVELENKEVYDHCEKHHLKLVDENGNAVITQRVSFSNWQLEDDNYPSRVKQWAEKRVSEEVDREKDIKLDYTL